MELGCKVRGTLETLIAETYSSMTFGWNHGRNYIDWLLAWFMSINGWDWLTALACTFLHCIASNSMMINGWWCHSRLMTSYNWCQPVGQAHTDFLSYLLHLAGCSDLALNQQALNHWASGGWGSHQQVLSLLLRLGNIIQLASRMSNTRFFKLLLFLSDLRL